MHVGQVGNTRGGGAQLIMSTPNILPELYLTRFEDRIGFIGIHNLI